MPRHPLNQKTIERIREVCEITERLGRATSPMVLAMARHVPSSVWQLGARAMGA